MMVVWLLAFLLYGPAIIFWEFIVGGSTVPDDECFAEFYYTWYFLLCASTFEFFSPFVSVTFFNLRIYQHIHKRSKRRNRWRATQGVESVGRELRPQQPGCRGFPEMAEVLNITSICPQAKPLPSNSTPTHGATTSSLSLFRDKKVAKSLAVIVCVFGVCWAPYTLLMIIRAACRGRCVGYLWYEITFWLLWLNSAINPFLYPLCHHSFRRAFGKVLCHGRQALQPRPQPV
ncbi:hypothetical protein JZ751_015550 [Albula glossodonta]|uniref:G-protein coupled receptors family 1 profile domain-containing protein n=1 Tax=Albula glossodonta TaxID=121402 RepID=A0A8T2N6S2_9TELE|nr:hypothetical protein JZ751_015550 [Albula glossodonta]